ncbi:hypothetical protein GGD81_004657 [Rhodobium orientis]|uniref:Uncharacterized protein n=1 Tax=Rhodobium orientis TaxID=34017 RepID=A0A327JJW1_9HYPH|nr:DUF1178 family protein [Rhodobium orientis]MBB4305576.1 hypothetical protein [Rhodobium orientis]MBK5948754.1 hypothetical protein [Rhodobium orientis]RAI25092.1 hypothetical protein CH339_19655 [Rhodobium orientis]
MIRYQLVCGNGHDLEIWFRGSDDCDRQIAEGAISCPHCGNREIAKKLMAPSVVTARSRAVSPEDQSKPDGPSQGGGAVPQQAANVPVPVATQPPVQTPDISGHLSDKQMTKLVEMVREVKKFVTENAENVGKEFPKVARAMHFGDEEKRGIYGEATLEDAAELLEEGIDVLPLPRLPEEHN